MQRNKVLLYNTYTSNLIKIIWRKLDKYALYLLETTFRKTTMEIINKNFWRWSSGYFIIFCEWSLRGWNCRMNVCQALMGIEYFNDTKCWSVMFLICNRSNCSSFHTAIHCIGFRARVDGVNIPHNFLWRISWRNQFWYWKPDRISDIWMRGSKKYFQIKNRGRNFFKMFSFSNKR